MRWPDHNPCCRCCCCRRRVHPVGEGKPLSPRKQQGSSEADSSETDETEESDDSSRSSCSGRNGRGGGRRRRPRGGRGEAETAGRVMSPHKQRRAQGVCVSAARTPPGGRGGLESSEGVVRESRRPAPSHTSLSATCRLAHAGRGWVEICDLISLHVGGEEGDGRRG